MRQCAVWDQLSLLISFVVSIVDLLTSVKLSLF